MQARHNTLPTKRPSSPHRPNQQLPSADAVEYWRAPEKAGWLQSQGDVVKTWRKRWIVLKQGYMFRFMGPDVTGGWWVLDAVGLGPVWVD